jgi:hypothetical protein
LQAVLATVSARHVHFPAASDMQPSKEQSQDKDGDPKALYPARYTRRRFARVVGVNAVAWKV